MRSRFVPGSRGRRDGPGGSGSSPGTNRTGGEVQLNIMAARAVEERSAAAVGLTASSSDVSAERSGGGGGGAVRKTKRIILIRHARSTWNEFLGQHKRAEWEEQERQRRGLRESLISIVRKPADGDDLDDSEKVGDQPSLPQQQASQAQSSASQASLGQQPQHRGFWQGVRGGVKHVVNAVSHAGKLNQVDHQLSVSGIAEARALRASILAVCDAAAAASSGEPDAGSELAPAQDSPERPADPESKPKSAYAAAEGADATEAAAAFVSPTASAGGSPTSPRGGSGSQDGGPEGILLDCKIWFVSPFLRALQTAAYALSPLRRCDSSMQIRVTPLANEIVKSSLCQDCQGKKGNVGFRVTIRALAKTLETLEEEEDDPACRSRSSCVERQDELADVSSTLCAMDLTEIASVWWSDVGSFKREHLRLEDMRIRRLVASLLKQEADVVGLVAHSLLFQRMLQLFWPRDPALQEELRASMLQGAPPESKDPLRNKIMNCGTLVLTWSYWELPEAVTVVQRADAEIVGARFLFGGQLEGAGGGDGPNQEPTDDGDGEVFEELGNFIGEDVVVEAVDSDHAGQ
mmetsp:Transcript_45218/g.131580  ORF Transcript_45218/g.131580 Transcript_45218/m.131580 type:complete len:577 (+) Transcript_45218:2-1732(+)